MQVLGVRRFLDWLGGEQYMVCDEGDLGLAHNHGSPGQAPDVTQGLSVTDTMYVECLDRSEY
jgi:hypothetical protein